MEEDTYMEWEIQRSEEEEKNSGKMTSWMFEKAVSAGKKILVTGFVITSAPVLLPPLVVISAIGLVCSVPYGVLFASYACTQKLMNTLLPVPSPSPLAFEYGTKYYDYDYDHDGGDIDMVGDTGEELLLEEPKGRADEVIKDQLPDEEQVELIGNQELDADVLEENDRKQQYSEEIEMTSEDKTGADEHGDFGDQVSGVMIVVEGDDVQVAEAPFEVTSVAVELFVGTDDNEEDNELVRQTRGLIETIRDIEGHAGNDAAQDKRGAENVHLGTEEGENEIDSGDQEIDERLPRVKGDVGGVQVTTPTVVQIGNEAVSLEKVNENKIRSDVSSNVMQPNKEIRDTTEKMNADDKRVKEVQVEAILLEGTTHDNVADVVTPDFKPNIVKTIDISSNEDAREIADESGFDLFDEKNSTGGHQYTYADSGIPEGIEQSAYVVPKKADSLELTIPLAVKQVKDGGMPHRGDIKMASNEVLYSEEKIWKQIRAMRTIVGYTAPLRMTFIEELKSLYIFTGVEPPSSFKYPSDLEEINEKLRFLMSIVGVK